MNFESCRRALIGAGVIAALMMAAPAFAQTGQIRGKVVDAEGKPVEDAKIILDYRGGVTRVMETKTNNKGDYIQVGLQTGEYEVTAEKGDLKQTFTTRVRLGQMTELNFQLVPGAVGAGGALTPEEAKKMEERRKALESAFTEGAALIEAGSYDAGIAKMNEVITDTGACAVCHAKIGEANFRKGDLVAAEAAYKKAIEIDPKLADPYAGLASLYNQQKKFDDAAAMSQKANELAGALGGGGQSAAVVFNQGIIFWNQSKIPEAKAQFEQAIKLDPTLADAHYWFGMALVNEGKLPESVASFEKYVSLAPDGQYAEQAKGMIAAIKK